MNLFDYVFFILYRTLLGYTVTIKIKTKFIHIWIHSLRSTFARLEINLKISGHVCPSLTTQSPNCTSHTTANSRGGAKTKSQIYFAWNTSPTTAESNYVSPEEVLQVITAAGGPRKVARVSSLHPFTRHDVGVASAGGVIIIMAHSHAIDKTWTLGSKGSRIWFSNEGVNLQCLVPCETPNLWEYFQ